MPELSDLEVVKGRSDGGIYNQVYLNCTDTDGNTFQISIEVATDGEDDYCIQTGGLPKSVDYAADVLNQANNAENVPYAFDILAEIQGLEAAE